MSLVSIVCAASLDPEKCITPQRIQEWDEAASKDASLVFELIFGDSVFDKTVYPLFLTFLRKHAHRIESLSFYNCTFTVSAWPQIVAALEDNFKKQTPCLKEFNEERSGFFKRVACFDQTSTETNLRAEADKNKHLSRLFQLPTLKNCVCNEGKGISHFTSLGDSVLQRSLFGRLFGLAVAPYLPPQPRNPASPVGVSLDELVGGAPLARFRRGAGSPTSGATTPSCLSPDPSGELADGERVLCFPPVTCSPLLAYRALI